MLIKDASVKMVIYRQETHNPLLHAILPTKATFAFIRAFMLGTGCSGKFFFFTIHCNSSLAYIAVRDLQKAFNAMLV